MTQPGPASTAGTIYVGVSTKMYLGYRDSLRWLGELRHEVDARPALAAGRVVTFVIPSFPVLPAASKIIASSPLILGAQNCGWADGPWTGEVSPSLLAELGVRLVEIGHAERRRHFGEDDAMVALKVKAADDAGVTPLLCVGEEAAPAADADPADAAEAAATFVYGQIEAAVRGDWGLAARLVIAYEPVWAIGAAEPASARYVSAVVRSLRELLAAHRPDAHRSAAHRPDAHRSDAHRMDGGPSLQELPVIYGGSAKPGLLPTLEGVSGLFLGRFAHDAANFGKVLDEALSLSEAPSVEAQSSEDPKR